MPTGVIYDERMTQHFCLWDPNHNEKPERFTRILERCKELGLLDRCQRIPSRKATMIELEKLHDQEVVGLLKSTENMRDCSELEELSSKYDFLYIHPSTYELSLLAAGSSIELVSNILEGKVKNGMAIVRPPGHHAMKVEYCGYCFFNNVALAAQEALDRGLERILIVDWDIHHGQASQQMFYEDPRVLYFSIHGYQNGAFWPHLRESDYHYIGRGAGLGYNVNVPLNTVGMGNQDYLAIFQQLLLPIAYEFNPELILVSAGYDAALGCPEGEMEVTPACYSHFTSSLMGLAEGKIAVFLEGGYCLKSLAESAAMTLRTLLGDPTPAIDSLIQPCQSVKESILSVSYVLRNHWKCLDHYETFVVDSGSSPENSQDRYWPKLFFVGNDEKPARYPTRGICPAQDPKVAKDLDDRLEILIKNTSLNVPPYKVGLAIEADVTSLGCYKIPDECQVFRTEADGASAFSQLIDAVAGDDCRSGVVVATDSTHKLLDMFDNATKNRGINRILLVNLKSKLDDLSTKLSQDNRLLAVNLYTDSENSGESPGLSNAINVNLPCMDDSTVIAALFRLLLPIAYQFNPQLVFVNANATSDAFPHILHQLTALARGRLVVFVENQQLLPILQSSVETLLGNPIPPLTIPVEEKRIAAKEAIREAILAQKSAWSSLAFQVKLPKHNILVHPWVEDAKHAKFNPEIQRFHQ